MDSQIGPLERTTQLNSNTVAIVKVEGDIRLALNHGLSLVGGLDVNNEEKLVIKPNLCSPYPPETGATNDVRIVQELLNYLLNKASCKVSIVESDNYARKCKRVFERLGYRSLERIPGVRLVDLSSEDTVTREIHGKFFKEIEVPETLSNYDRFITVAKLKTSIIHGMTGASKNQFGCLPAREKRNYHPFLSEVLFDLNTLFKPDLCVVDGIVGMDGCGPTDGFPVEMNLLILGKDPVTVDAVLCHVMGIDPFEVPHLKYAYENGFGELEIGKINVLGERLEKVRTDFSLVPKNAYSWMNRGLKLGRFPLPIRNLGILMFTWGNYQAGKNSSIRANRHRQEGGISFSWKILKKALWTRHWNV